MGNGDRTALVLSAGGMFGAWQAGVWRALAPHVRPDLIVGASIGSLNGWLISSGIDPDALTERWLAPGEVTRIRLRIPRHRKDGILDASRLHTTLQELCSEHEPVTPFGVVVTEMPAMRPRLFQYPELTWQHIAASCAVPFLLPQQRLDDCWCIDGGMRNPLPLWAAVEMGATRIIAINAMKRTPEIRTGPGGVEFIELGPGEALGPWSDMMFWTQAKAERWIRRGETDGELWLPRVVEYVSRSFTGCTDIASTA